MPWKAAIIGIGIKDAESTGSAPAKPASPIGASRVTGGPLEIGRLSLNGFFR